MDVKITDIDYDRKKVSLSIRALLNDARAALKEKPGRIIAIIDGSALSKTGASVAIIASVAAAMLAVGAGVMALRRKRS